MNNSFLLLTLTIFSPIAFGQTLAVYDAMSDRCLREEILPGIPAISSSTGGAEIRRQLEGLGNTTAFVRRSGRSVRAFFLFHQTCEGEGLDDEFRKYEAEKLLHTLFITVPHDNTDNRASAYLTWAFVDAFLTTKNNSVFVYQQAIGDVPILGAEARVEFGAFGEITSISATPVDIETYDNLIGAYVKSEGLKALGPPSNVASGHTQIDKPIRSIFIGSHETEPKPAWRYQNRESTPNQVRYDVVIEAESGDVLRDIGLEDEDNYVSTTGAGRVADNDDDFTFPIECTRDRVDCKLSATQEINGIKVTITVKPDSSSDSLWFESDDDSFKAEADSPLAAAIITYDFLWDIVEMLLREYRPPNKNMFPTDITAIISTTLNEAGRFRDGIIEFGKLESSAEEVVHGGEDRHIIAHELVHLMRRVAAASDPESRISKFKCSGIVGEQFHAFEESIADVLAVLFEAVLLEKSIPSTFGERSLGERYRNLERPDKWQGDFDPDIIKAGIDDRKTLESVWKELTYKQPESMSALLPYSCDDGDEWEKIKYVNMGVPNAAMYDLLALPQEKRPDPTMGDADWYKFWIRTLTNLAYNRELECRSNSCDDLCDIALVILSDAYTEERRIRQLLPMILKKHGIDPYGDCREMWGN